MEVCCLKMASRCRPPRAVQMDVTRLPVISSSHDCGSLSRVVMVRKTDQRMINHKKPQSDPQCEFVTFETIQTYKGHKPDRTVVFTEKHDLNESEVQKSPSARRFMRSSSSTVQSGIQSMTISTNDITSTNNTTTGISSRPHSSSVALTNGSSTNNRLINGHSRFSTPNLSIRHKSPSPILRKTGLLNFNEFEKDCLRAHNECRQKHHCSPLKLNKKLCRFADEWAKVIAARGTPAHRNNSPYGENIFCSWSSNTLVQQQIDGCEPVEHWYSEVGNHCFGKEPTTLKTGHFTQVVWKDSRELGVGVAKNRSGQVFVVVNYDPPGNFIGSFAENVPPIGGFIETPRIIIQPAGTTSATASAATTATDDANNDDQQKNQLTISIDSSLSNGTSSSNGSNSSTSKDIDLEKFIFAILRYHNEYRRKHGSPELKLCDKLCIISQDWAETLAREDRFAYRPNTNYGENIYCLWSSDRCAKANPKNVCRSWYDENKEHNFNGEPRGAFKGGHFTQMIWKTTKDLGVGVAKTKRGKVLVVCNYHPRGNVVGEFCTNVQKLIRVVI